LVELQEDQATYDQHNKVPDIQTAVIAYINNEPVASGCFKQYTANTVEIKRMYVKKAFRGEGLSKLVLQELEAWALDNGYRYAVLETSIHFMAARRLYETNGYQIISNYPPYKDLTESVCMKKELLK
jgi:putative acetyltransferase